MDTTRLFVHCLVDSIKALEAITEAHVAGRLAGQRSQTDVCSNINIRRVVCKRCCEFTLKMKSGNSKKPPYTDLDILIYKGSTRSERDADTVFRDFIVVNSILYSNLRNDDHSKREFAGALYEYITTVQGRRFYMRNLGTTEWVELDRERVVEKIMARLRERWVKEEVNMQVPWPLGFLMNANVPEDQQLHCMVKSPHGNFIPLTSVELAKALWEQGSDPASVFLVRSTMLGAAELETPPPAPAPAVAPAPPPTVAVALPPSPMQIAPTMMQHVAHPTAYPPGFQFYHAAANGLLVPIHAFHQNTHHHFHPGLQRDDRRMETDEEDRGPRGIMPDASSSADVYGRFVRR